MVAGNPSPRCTGDGSHGSGISGGGFRTYRAMSHDSGNNLYANAHAMCDVLLRVNRKQITLESSYEMP